ncbi:hypothetical protein BU23DRAFT_35025 [Bimuria novae-zelandiae CBS 107.79]|uniref:Uncharacterized protein n=1 Tax=Bimuria novae-zelandiae CBS 107.79 TaxID=1447943 RepID=A0A6A5UKD7_9PLEO|nr:hypothetical protein BU23DRAFT_35025 [Bimuria novae-zelandiae CBS 107.79]
MRHAPFRIIDPAYEIYVPHVIQAKLELFAHTRSLLLSVSHLLFHGLHRFGEMVYAVLVTLESLQCAVRLGHRSLGLVFFFEHFLRYTSMSSVALALAAKRSRDCIYFNRTVGRYLSDGACLACFFVWDGYRRVTHHCCGVRLLVFLGIDLFISFHLYISVLFHFHLHILVYT